MNVYNAADRKSIRKAEKSLAVATRERREFLVNTLRSPAGRRFFYDLLADAHIFHDPFTGEPLREAFLKGERNFGMRILDQILSADPEAYILMIREHNERHSAGHTDDDPAGERPDSEESGRIDQGPGGDAE